MAGTRGHRDRGARNKKGRRKVPSASPETKSKPKSKRPYADTKYGPVPLVECQAQDANGRTVRYLQYDPDFKPRIPSGAVEGDVRRQVFCSLCHVPRYYYTDEPKKCVQCGGDFVFSGKEQKYWYETLQFNFNSVAIRCPSCRRRRRSQAALGNQLAFSQARLRETPDDPDALLTNAEARVRYYQRTGHGDLNRAIASSRKALRIWPKAVDGWFWEGLAQHLAGRSHKALPLLERFLKQGQSKRRRKGLLHREAAALVRSMSTEADAE